MCPTRLCPTHLSMGASSALQHRPTSSQGTQRNHAEPRAHPPPDFQPNLLHQHPPFKAKPRRVLHNIKLHCSRHKNKVNCRGSFSYPSQDKEGSIHTSSSSISHILFLGAGCVSTCPLRKEAAVANSTLPTPEPREERNCLLHTRETPVCGSLFLVQASK